MQEDKLLDTLRCMDRALRFFAVIVLLAATAGCSEIPPLSATFTYSPASGESPLAVRFDAAVTPSVAAHYGWDFGDGTHGAGQHTAHTYQAAAPATFHVVLTVRDEEGRGAEARADVTVVPHTAPAPVVRFTWPFHFDAEGDDAANLNDEYFTLENTGTTTADMAGWTVENERARAYCFPDGTRLLPRAILTVHSGAGRDTASVFYWNAESPVWNDTSDLAILRDAAGEVVDVYGYASCAARLAVPHHAPRVGAPGGK